MAATSLTRTYNNILTTTNDWLSKQGKAEDIVFKSNPTLSWLMKQGRYEPVRGGDKWMVNLMYAQNDTVDSVSERQIVDTAPSEGLTRAYYDRAIYNGQLSITKLDMDKNQGAARVIDLVKEERRRLMLSMKERINKDLWALSGLTTAVTGNGGKNLISIPMIATKLTTVDIGGIDMSVETDWVPQTWGTATTSWAILQNNLRRIVHNCSKGAPGKPDVLIASLNAFMAYEGSLQSVARYQNNPKSAGIDFPSVEGPAGIPMFWDEHVPDPEVAVDYDAGTYANESVYAINSEYLKLGYSPDYNFSFGSFKEPHDQPLALVASMIEILQLMCLNRKKQGVLYNIDQNIAA